MASIMPDEVGSAALLRTAEDLEAGTQRLGAQAALPVVAGWQRRLEETGHPDLLPVAGTLSEPRLHLSGGVRDPAAVGELLRLSALLAGQSRVLLALAS